MTRDWWRRNVGAVGAVALLVLGSMDLVQHYGIKSGALAFSAARAVPLVIYRWRPVAAWWLELAAGTATALVGPPVSASEPWPWAVTTVAPVTALSGVIAARGDRRLDAALLAVIGATGSVLVLAFPSRGNWSSVVTMTVFCVVGMVLGDVLNGRRRLAGELAVEQQVSAEERARRWLAEERSRIARELHDVVAHHMSLISVQAETARYRMTGLPGPVVEEFAGIARLARGSLTELRGLLAVLRDERDPAEQAPQPDLRGLPELVERTAKAGTPANLSITGDGLAELPDVVQLTGYRIVQESLSNVVRHAPGARTEVTVELTGPELHIEITNARPALTKPVGSGHGLLGLRERAALLNGTLQVDQPDGGWRVRATLPAKGFS